MASRPAAVLNQSPPASVASVPTLECFEMEFGRPARGVQHEGDDPVGGRLGWFQKVRATFVYVDGTFRFFGPDTRAFWDTPQHSSPTTSN
jgi:hypothetical protein